MADNGALRQALLAMTGPGGFNTTGTGFPSGQNPLLMGNGDPFGMKGGNPFAMSATGMPPKAAPVQPQSDQSGNSFQNTRTAAGIASETNPILKGLGEAMNTPVIKNIINALSSGTYAAGNASNDALDTIDSIKNKGRVDASDAVNILNGASGFKALGEGLVGGFGNTDYQKTQAPAIAKIQKDVGIDPTSGASKAVQGWGGLAGDIAFDPTNLIGVGEAGAAAKGFVRGATLGKGEAKLIAKEGAEESVANPSRWGNAVDQAKVEA